MIVFFTYFASFCSEFLRIESLNVFKPPNYEQPFRAVLQTPPERTYLPMLPGSHLSVAGGLANALTAAEDYKFQSVALFVRNQRQWASKHLESRVIDVFRETRAASHIKKVAAHGIYLMNLASRTDIREKSLQALADDLSRCSRLGIEYLVIHPGSNADLAEGVDMIAAGINQVFHDFDGQSMLLLETTAGQGNCIGYRFEHLAAIIDKLAMPDKVGVCVDTAHIFAAGYDIRTAEDCEKTFRELDKTVGLSKVKVLHINDSQKELGSRVDRHAHIGHGKIGLQCFRWLVNYKPFRNLPFIMETPKGKNSKGSDWDIVNAEILRKMLAD